MVSPVARWRELFLRSLEGLVALSAEDSSVMLGDVVSSRPLGDGVPPVLPRAPRVSLGDGLAVALPYGDAVRRGLADAVAYGLADAVPAGAVVALGDAVAAGEGVLVTPPGVAAGEPVGIGLAVAPVVVAVAPPVTEVWPVTPTCPDTP